MSAICFIGPCRTRHNTALDLERGFGFAPALQRAVLEIHLPAI
jgi:hypothetical protein